MPIGTANAGLLPATPSGLDQEGRLVQQWLAAMRRGDFASAWRISDRTLALRGSDERQRQLPRHLRAVWDGTPIEGRPVVVECNHGLGDTVQFARFLPSLRALASDLLVLAPIQLVDLLRTIPNAGRIEPEQTSGADLQGAVRLEIMEIGHVLRVTLETVPARVPYLHVRPAARPSSCLSVGIVVQAGGWNARRCVPPPLVDETIRGIAGVEFFSLQPGVMFTGGVDASEPDLMRAAARVRSLDLVITVDTLMAHLAGALGVPTWTLLPAESDWRWMEGRSDSPWYPTMRLFRQPSPGDWGAVLRDVRDELQTVVNQSRGAAVV